MLSRHREAEGTRPVSLLTLFAFFFCSFFAFFLRFATNAPRLRPASLFWFFDFAAFNSVVLANVYSFCSTDPRRCSRRMYSTSNITRLGFILFYFNTPSSPASGEVLTPDSRLPRVPSVADSSLDAGRCLLCWNAYAFS